MGAAVAVGGVGPQRRAFDALAGMATRQWGGVQQPQPIPPRRRAGGQVADRHTDQVAGGAQPLVVAGLARQVGKQMSQPGVGEPQPMPLRASAKQHLGDRQADQLSVAELGWVTGPAPRSEQVIDGDVQCGDEVVEVGAHKAPWVDVAVATPIFGDLASFLIAQQRRPNTESII
jgi:hypothetical protein